MTDALLFGISNVVPSIDVEVGGDDIVAYRHHVMCATVAHGVSDRGRSILYPTLRIQEEPSEVMDGIELSIRVMTIPMERV